ncbi:hypothetical protein [Campylobacter porcelli]|uniref:Uncharacterized protein n=1 Tax=Campylobacter porcelli TaxID=1660073 RepID=A0ABU7M4H5_9BACT|nr:hypothetical protein [Campylobacter sp. CX2-4855-23]
MSYDISTGKLDGIKIGRGCVELPPILEDKNSVFWGYKGEIFVLKNSGIIGIVLENIDKNNADSIENLKNSNKIMYLSTFIGKGE